MNEKLFFVAFAVIALLSLAVGVWIHFVAPCGAIDWMPVKDLPARCLP